MSEVGLFMLDRKGTTLIETLLAFSVFVSCVIVLLSCYTTALKHYNASCADYKHYLEIQKEKELSLWQTSDLVGAIKEVLP